MIAGGLFWITLLVAVVLYWSLPRWRDAVLLAASGAYLLTIAPASTAALVGWFLLFYLAAPLVRPEGSRARITLAGLILAILGYLATFKYLPPVVSTVAKLLGTSDPTLDLVLPFGISYFTFKLIHYAVETHRGTIAPHPPHRFLLYLLFFPIFPAGPIERFGHFWENREQRWESDLFVEGVTRITYGMIKKFVIAESFLMTMLRFPNPTTDLLLRTLEERSALEVWAHVSVWFVYLYFDFSGYCDIAIGASRLFSFKITENFNYPLLVLNLRDFWSRWHMSLTRWCFDYVFVPVSLWTRRPHLATLATLTAVGLWHGGSLNWLCFGLYHGVGLVAFETWVGFKRRRRLFRKPNPYVRVLARVVTFLFLSASFTFVVTDGRGIGAGWRLFAKLFGIDLSD